MNDVELHERIILLDADAITTWQEQNSPIVLGWLRRRGVMATEAEEIWNDVLFATVRAAAGLHPRGSSLRRYAFGVARRQQAERYRKVQIETIALPDEVPTPPQAGRVVDERRVAALR